MPALQSHPGCRARIACLLNCPHEIPGRLTRLLPTGRTPCLPSLCGGTAHPSVSRFRPLVPRVVRLVPLLWAIEREKESTPHSFILGWIWGFVFFTGTCWWLTFAPITYAGLPAMARLLAVALCYVRRRSISRDVCRDYPGVPAPTIRQRWPSSRPRLFGSLRSFFGIG